MERTPKNPPDRRAGIDKSLLRFTSDIIPTPAISALPDGSIDFINQRWLDYMGLTLEEVRDWGWTSAIHPDDVEGFVSEWHAAIKAGESIEKVARFRRADGEYRRILLRLKPFLDERGTIIRWEGTRIDVEDRKQGEEEYRALIESAPDAMIIINEEGKILIVNSQTEKLFGYGREELYGQTVEKLIPERFRGRHLEHQRAFIQEQKTRAMGGGLDLYGLRNDGSEFPIDISLSPLNTKGGLMVTAAIRDITERKKAEKALQESEERVRRLTDKIPEVIGMKLLHEAGSANESAVSKHDVPLEASIPDNAVPLESILCTEELGNRPSRPPDYKKETDALVALSSALADSPRTILQTLAETILDVTQCDSSGLSLLTKNDGGKRFYWPAIAGAWKPHIGGGTPRNNGPCGDVLDRNCTLVFRHFERRYPYLLPVIPSAEECLLVPFYVEGKAVGTIWAIMHTDRRKFDAEDERLMIVLGKFASSAYQTVASIEDLTLQISEREKAQTALRELADSLETRVRVRTEELEQRNNEIEKLRDRFKGVLEIAQDAIISVDSKQRIILFNQGAEKVFGYARAEVLGNPLEWLLPQRFGDVHRRHIEEFVRSADVARTMGRRQEVSGRRKDGREFSAEASISKLDLGGEMVFTVILRDITERKRAEQRLVAQHTVTQILAVAATLEEASPKILQAVCECLVWDLGEVWRTDRAAGVLRCVEVWHKESIEVPQFESTSRDMTFMPGIGLPGRVWAGREPAYIPDVVQDSNFPRAPIAASEGLHAAFAFPILLGRDVVGVMAFFSREIRQPEQDMLDMMATIGSQIGQFIERKWAEEKLRRSEAYLAEAQRLSRTGSFGWKVTSGELFWSKETFCILGYDQGTKPTLDLVYQRVHPEDIPIVQQTFDCASRDGTDLDFENRLLMPDGSVKHVHVVAHAVKNESGQLEYVGAVSDVTAARKAEERIRQDEREFRQIVEAIPQLIIVMAPDGSYLYANERMLEYTGYTQEDVVAEGFRERIFHPDDVKRLRDERLEALSRGVQFEMEQRVLGTDGKYRWFLTRFNPVRDEQGHVVRWYATGTDIDDRKQTEDRIQNENIALREEVDKVSMFEEIIGTSRSLRATLARAVRVAPMDSTVLITGETGTGKELIARAIHKRSPRSSQAFISVNCAAIPPSLLASELFGHEKGAFTGALQRRLGRFELAEGGTIFLDEIGEMPLDTQTTLLRVLQEHVFERVGGNHSIQTDSRVIAATNRDLKAAVDQGTFRSDLFYRLNVFPIDVPPLRARQDDIPMLVKYFVDRYGTKAGKRFRSIDQKTLSRLRSYPWPGNVRELQNVIERSVILSDTENFSIDESWLFSEALPMPGAGRPLFRQLSEREKEMIESALRQSHGRVSGPSGAAAMLGIPASTLESKIRSLKINKHHFKSV